MKYSLALLIGALIGAVITATVMVAMNSVKAYGVKVNHSKTHYYLVVGRLK